MLHEALWGLSYPMFYLSLPVAIVSGIVLIVSMIQRADQDPGDKKWADYYDMGQTAIKFGVPAALLMAFSYAIPPYEPQVIVKEKKVVEKVNVPVEKVIYKVRPGTLVYQDKLTQCTEGMTAYDNQDLWKYCHEYALSALMALGYIRKPDLSYKEVFEICSNKGSLENAPAHLFGQWRNERTAICTKAALEATR